VVVPRNFVGFGGLSGSVVEYVIYNMKKWALPSTEAPAWLSLSQTNGC